MQSERLLPVKTKSSKIQHLQKDVGVFADRTADVSDRVSEIAAINQERTTRLAKLDQTLQNPAQHLGEDGRYGQSL